MIGVRGFKGVNLRGGSIYMGGVGVEDCICSRIVGVFSSFCSVDLVQDGGRYTRACGDFRREHGDNI